MHLKVFQIPAFRDNYIWVIKSGDELAVIDPGDPAPVEDFLESEDLRLTYIWNTHHHMDHVGGNLRLKERYGCKIIGPAADKERIPGIDILVDEGDHVNLGKAQAEVIFTPGHTTGHICYYFGDDRKTFVGDTLFAMGCGRLFEGTPAQMWHSLGKIRTWTSDTMIYCAHEYTETNGRFALTIEPDNPALQARMTEVRQARAQGRSTVPFLLSDDLATNPFLRADSDNIKQALNIPAASAVETFAHLRQLKDDF